MYRPYLPRSCYPYYRYHPHGMIVTGLAGSLAANDLNLTRLYPGMRFRACTLNVFFYVPVTRDMLMAFGRYILIVHCS